MSTSDYIVLLTIALPLVGKLAIDVAAYFAERKRTALANIFGMVGRQAASAARALSTLPPGANFKEAESIVLANARAAVVAEMDRAMPIASVTPNQVAKLVQGELDKLVVAPIAIVPVAAS